MNRNALATHSYAAKIIRAFLQLQSAYLQPLVLLLAREISLAEAAKSSVIMFALLAIAVQMQIVLLVKFAQTMFAFP